MVHENMGLPDPHDSDASLGYSSDNVMQMVNNADVNIDDNFENNPYEGYQQLNGHESMLDEETDSETDDEQNIDSESVQVTPHSGLPSIDNAELALRKEVWTETHSKDIEMGSEKVQAVKDAMQNFTLPANCIPDWATNIPEQEWKEHMLQRIQAKTKEQKK